MKILVRLVVLVAITSIALSPASAFPTADVVALGFTEAEAENEPADEEPAFDPNMEPAVVSPPADDAAREEPWTALYLAPVLLLGGVLALGSYGALYLVRVRGKYDVVD